jgi:hypothetical protein
MNSKLIIPSVVEFVALLFIARLWWRRIGGVGSRIAWTFVLLIPLAGLILYAMTRSDPERHPFDAPDSTGVSSSGGDPGA